MAEGHGARLSPLFTWRSAVSSPEGPDSSTTRHVLLALSLHMSQKGGSCFPSTRTLAAETGLSRRTVEAHLRRADEEGWIDKSEPERGADGRYVQAQYRATVPGEALSHGPGETEHIDHGKEIPHRTLVQQDVKTPTSRSGTRDAPDDEPELRLEHPDANGGRPPEERLHDVFVDVLGGDPPQPSLTDKRRRKYRAWWSEWAGRLPDPEEAFRGVCEQVAASDFHSRKRAYQMPESFLTNEERRERWTLDALQAASGRHADDLPDDATFAEIRAHQRKHGLGPFADDD